MPDETETGEPANVPGDAIRPLLPIIVQGLMSGLFTYLAAKGVSIDERTQGHITAGTIALVLASGILAGGLSKWAAARRWNPSNAAKPSIVATTSPSAPGPTLLQSSLVSPAWSEAEDAAKKAAERGAARAGRGAVPPDPRFDDAP